MSPPSVCSRKDGECPHADTLSRIEEKLDVLDNFIRGDVGSAGLITRVDRLEQTDQRRNWWTTTAVGAAITSLVGAAFSIFQK